jgi:four helix bundle protein
MVSGQGAAFDHEKLEVYRETIAFNAWLSGILESTRVGDVKDQLDRASTSIALNIAEGNGKYAPKDRCRFFDIAHGSALECAAGLDVLVAKAKLTRDQILPRKERLQTIVRMLIGLIKRNSTREYKPNNESAAGERLLVGRSLMLFFGTPWSELYSPNIFAHSLTFKAK